MIFTDEPLRGTIGEVVSRAGLRQLRIAETEKYAHVTYFFNGSEEVPFAGEERALIPSPKVATYDLKPEMSAAEVTDEVVRRLTGETYGFFVLNFANADMVGHTGSSTPRSAPGRDRGQLSGRVLEAVESRVAWPSSPPTTGTPSRWSTTRPAAPHATSIRFRSSPPAPAPIP